GTFHMMISNPVIDIDGDTATAEFMWTGVINRGIQQPPELLEQGREYDLLVRQGGEWRIKKRVVIADSGLPERYMATYEPRRDTTSRLGSRRAPSAAFGGTSPVNGGGRDKRVLQTSPVYG